MNFNSRIAKVGRGTPVNGYKSASGDIVLYMNNNGLKKKRLSETEFGFTITAEEFSSDCSEIIQLSDTNFIKRTNSVIKVDYSEN